MSKLIEALQILGATAMTYRKRRTSDTWHFDPACSNWPHVLKTLRFEERKAKPKSGELCDQCKAKAKRKGKKR